ncbi:hypothetical protein B484DRAFT_397271 [Ochromonadaceae sp. CCMP2298]|nr:hypothetical protein B484DRAFT_397271 [Ochromonadaceae sp. CCMP2298]
MPVFCVPVAVFVLFSVLASCGLCARLLADACSFGGDKTIKLIVKQLGAGTGAGAVKPTCVWLSSEQTSVWQVRAQIAEALGVLPDRVRIESGRGRALDEQHPQPFFAQHVSRRSTDLFGFVTAVCYVAVAPAPEEYDLPVNEQAETDLRQHRDRRGSANPFKNLIDNRAKYGHPFTIIGRSAAPLTEGSTPAKKFHIAPVATSRPSAL